MCKSWTEICGKGTQEHMMLIYSTTFNNTRTHSTTSKNTRTHSTTFNNTRIHSTTFNTRTHSTTFNTRTHSTTFKNTRTHVTAQHSTTQELTAQHSTKGHTAQNSTTHVAHSMTHKQVIHFSERCLLAMISSARLTSWMSCKTFTRVFQVTGCLPLPVSHSWRISVFILSASSLNFCSIILILNPFLSSRRNVPKLIYLVDIATGILTTLLSVHSNFRSSCRVGLMPGLQDVFAPKVQK